MFDLFLSAVLIPPELLFVFKGAFLRFVQSHTAVQFTDIDYFCRTVLGKKLGAATTQQSKQHKHSEILFHGDSFFVSFGYLYGRKIL